MSKTTNPDTTPAVTVVPGEAESNVEVPKQSFIQRRIVTPIKNHPKIAAAVAGGFMLVGTAAYLGRSTDSETPSDDSYLTEDPELQALVEAEMAEDTTVA